MSFRVSAFYKFVPFADPEAIRADIAARFETLGIRGTVLVAATEADEVKVLANNLPVASGVVLVDRNRIAVEVKQMLPRSPGTR